MFRTILDYLHPNPRMGRCPDCAIKLNVYNSGSFRTNCPNCVATIDIVDGGREIRFVKHNV